LNIFPNRNEKKKIIYRFFYHFKNDLFLLFGFIFLFRSNLFFVPKKNSTLRLVSKYAVKQASRMRKRYDIYIYIYAFFLRLLRTEVNKGSGGELFSELLMESGEVVDDDDSESGNRGSCPYSVF
jgi:hypothetical protein